MKIGNICAKHPELMGRRHNGGNCPYCVREKRGYKLATPDSIKASNTKWRLANAEKIKAVQKNYRQQNPDKVRENNLRRTGFTLALFAEMLEAQNYLCAICETDLRTVPQKQIHADHCHLTKTPRGILCHHCNSGIGLFMDDPVRLNKAAQYLEKRKTNG